MSAASRNRLLTAVLDLSRDEAAEVVEALWRRSGGRITATSDGSRLWYRLQLKGDDWLVISDLMISNTDGITWETLRSISVGDLIREAGGSESFDVPRPVAGETKLERFARVYVYYQSLDRLRAMTLTAEELGISRATAIRRAKACEENGDMKRAATQNVERMREAMKNL